MSIGGEFDLDPAKLSRVAGGRPPVLFESGRSALFALLKQALPANAKVLVPEYICGSVLETVRASGLELQTYCLNQDLSPSLDDLSAQAGANSPVMVMFVNYFGLLDSEWIALEIRKVLPDCFLVADHVQAPFAPLLMTGVDAAFNSYRKVFPVPGGAMLKLAKGTIFPAEEESGAMAHRTMAMVRKYCQRTNPEIFREETFLREFSLGEDRLDTKFGPFAASIETIVALESVDLQAIESTRLSNANRVLEKMTTSEVIPDFVVTAIRKKQGVPLFVPILLPVSRETIRKSLQDNRMFLPVHWPQPKHLHVRGSVAKNWYLQELSLVIDQRYTASEMDHQTSALSTLISGSVR